MPRPPATRRRRRPRRPARRARQVVVAAVIERGGRVLVSQRGPGGGHPGLWEFPGGKREPGERDAQALRRELREELGIDVEVGERVWGAKAGPLDLRFFRCAYLAGSRPRPLGCTQFRWTRREDLTALRFPPANEGLVAALAAGAPPFDRGSLREAAPAEVR
jgi:A/G-specific adenine glycosylase